MFEQDGKLKRMILKFNTNMISALIGKKRKLEGKWYKLQSRAIQKVK
jgi:hypothetical protein